MAKTYYWLDKSLVYHEAVNCGAFKKPYPIDAASIRFYRLQGNLRQARGKKVNPAGGYDGPDYERRPCKRCKLLY